MSVPERLTGYRLNIGSVQPGWYNIDNRHVPGLDCLHDFESIPWPLEDSSAIIAQMGHVVSRINPARWGMLATMDELWRILKPSAQLCVITYYGTNSYFQGDPAACNPITELTWFHFDPEHRSGLWQHYQPLPWRLVDIKWSVDGNIETVLAKKGDMQNAEPCDLDALYYIDSAGNRVYEGGTERESPVRPRRIVVKDSGRNDYTNRLFVGTACTGNVRIEWVAARYNQMTPINWSMGSINQIMGEYYPLRHLVADAQNLIVAEAMRLDYEFLLLHEHDIILPPDCFVKLNKYMVDEKAPVVSGLYFSRAFPSDPMVFKTLGDSYATDWKLGDVVEVVAVPTGLVLIHMGLIRAMWADCEQYNVRGTRVRRVFNTPRDSWVNPETGEYSARSMTSDLDFCNRVIAGDYLRKAGWLEYADKPRPFLCDTGIFAYHCESDGRFYPDPGSLARWERD